MAYEKYKTIRSKEEFLATFEEETLKELSEELQEHIYNKYVVKAKVFQRDSFTCQNINCKSRESPLTLHHIKWRKNNGYDKKRNGITLCKACHFGYHKAKIGITFADAKYLPPHIRGHTFKLQKEEKLDWKQIRSEMALLRKNLKQEHGIVLTATQIRLLIKWLTIPYEEWDD